MLPLVMKLPVQTPSGKASCPLTRTPLLLNNPCSFIDLPTLSRHGAPATRLESAASTLFLSSRGCTPARDPFFFSQPPTPKRTNHESARTQLQFARIARQGRQSEVPSRHRLRTAVPPSRHPLRPLLSPCRFATAIRTAR